MYCFAFSIGPKTSSHEQWHSDQSVDRSRATIMYKLLLFQQSAILALLQITMYIHGSMKHQSPLSDTTYIVSLSI